MVEIQVLSDKSNLPATCLWYNKSMAAAMVPAVSVESTRVSPGFPICSSHNYSNASMPRCKMVTPTSAK